MQASPKSAINYQSVIACCLVVITIVTVASALLYTKSIMIPFVLALFISFSVMPLIKFFHARMKCPRIAAVFLTLGIVIFLLFLVSVLVTSNIRTFLINIDTYRSQLILMTDRSLDYLHLKGFTFQKSDIIASIQDLPVFSYMSGAASRMLSFVMDAILVTIFTMFMLTGKENELPPSGIWADISRDTRSYLWTKFISSTITGSLTALVLYIFGLEMAAMFGILAFLLNFIPTIGSLISVLIPIPIAILQFQNIWLAGACVALPGLIQFTIGNIIEPKYVGDTLDLHPVTILLSLMFWGLLWGIPGMILATPLCVISKLILENFAQTQWLANLMSGRLQEALLK